LLSAGAVIVIGEDENGDRNFKFLAPGSNQEISEFEGTLKALSATFNSGRKSWREIQLQ